MNTIVLNESGFDTGMTFVEYCELASQHGDNPADYGTDLDEFVFVSKDYARQDSSWWEDSYEEWPDNLPLWAYQPHSN